MKKLMMIAAIFAVSAQAHAFTLKELAGTYKVTTELAPITNTVSISADGAVKLVESSPYGTITCAGKAVLDRDVLTSEVTCENDLSFTQKIDLNNVKQLKSFKALVYSSLHEAELEMDFVKVK